MVVFAESMQWSHKFTYAAKKWPGSILLGEQKYIWSQGLNKNTNYILRFVSLWMLIVETGLCSRGSIYMNCWDDESLVAQKEVKYEDKPFLELYMRWKLIARDTHTIIILSNFVLAHEIMYINRTPQKELDMQKRSWEVLSQCYAY